MRLLSYNENQSMKDYIYKTLKYNIMCLLLKPGDRISESELQKIFNASKSPIRESLVKLKEEKLIDIFPQKGTFISKIDLNLVDDILFTRKVLENEILKIAVSSEKDKTLLLKKLKKNFDETKISSLSCHSSEEVFLLLSLDKEFHETLFEFAGRKNIWEMICSVGLHYERFRILETPEEENISFIFEQHQRIIDILEEKDEEKVKLIGELHVSNFKSSFYSLFKKYPSYFINYC